MTRTDGEKFERNQERKRMKKKKSKRKSNSISFQEAQKSLGITPISNNLYRRPRITAETITTHSSIFFLLRHLHPFIHPLIHSFILSFINSHQGLLSPAFPASRREKRCGRLQIFDDGWAFARQSGVPLGISYVHESSSFSNTRTF